MQSNIVQCLLYVVNKWNKKFKNHKPEQIDWKYNIYKTVLQTGDDSINIYYVNLNLLNKLIKFGYLMY